MEHLERVAEYLGVDLTPGQIHLLSRYSDWLISEAIPAGGLGPSEAGRVERRHIVDSLVFARFLDDPQEVWDLGSGVGLPGIPLSILLPDTPIFLIDRSGRRMDLMRRAIRILDLENAQAVLADIDEMIGGTDAIVSRGTFPPGRMLETAKRLLRPGGVAVLAGSWVTPPVEDGWETIEVPAEGLDRPVWILMMRSE